MIHVRIVAELPYDEYGPRVTYQERFVLPRSFAEDAADAHAKILSLIVTERYFELPQCGVGTIPLGAATVRAVAVWDGD